MSLLIINIFYIMETAKHNKIITNIPGLKYTTPKQRKNNWKN